jgi:hydrogenase maturation protein HypF
MTDVGRKLVSDGSGGEPARRLRVIIRGAVQGVGFRPFVFRLAEKLRLRGWVVNSTDGVVIEAEGDPSRLESFLRSLRAQPPPRSAVQSLEHSLLDPVGYASFEIRESDESGEKIVPVLPDIATCPECLHEILDPADRRHRYPFTNCTNCGPRFSIIQALPYDRPHTTMRGFAMCAACRKEYDDPRNRRFHAQPNACPVCGPRLALWDAAGSVLSSPDDALSEAANAVRRGAILAVKGLGGFHLIVDGRRDARVNRLRERKHRDEKPLALMYPSLDAVKSDCAVSEMEESLLTSPESPIVLLERRPCAGVARSVAPGNPYLGAMLPYTPLHHLLMRDLGFPVVATSGNLSEEPICTDEREVLERLGPIADIFLVHDRPIARHVDDSVVRVVSGRVLVLRRARGYAPLPIATAARTPRLRGRATLAVGGHLKNAVALAVGSQIFLSQHIGDMSTNAAFRAFESIIADFERLYGVSPERVVCDAHPDYRTTRFAATLSRSPRKIQHHQAHVFACMAENEIEPPLLGVSWDGTGFGEDGTVWGGEFFRVTPGAIERTAHLRTFPLPGGDQAVREPRRAAAGLLYEVFGDEAFRMDKAAPILAFSQEDRRGLGTVLRRRLNAPRTSSAGRLFDAVSSIVGIRQIANFEGQAAMELEFALAGVKTEECYPFAIELRPGPAVVDWEPMIRSILEDVGRARGAGVISAMFHNTLAAIIVRIAEETGVERVVLTGGCFQNRYLTEAAVSRLEGAGFRPYWHQRIPPNDGGIALGQIVASDFFDAEE